MKVVVQNGCEPTLSRKELEAMLVFFPTSWSKVVDTIALNQGKDGEATTKYFEKEKILGLFSSREPNKTPEKAKALETLLIGLAYVAENHSLPENLNKAVRNNFLEKTAAVLGKCRGVLSNVT